jgi:MFS family permease
MLMQEKNNSIFRGSFVLIFFASLLLFTAFYILLPTLPVFLTANLGIDERQTGIVLAVYTLAALLIRPFAGYMIDRHGRRVFMIFSYLIFALILPFYPLAGIFSLMILIRFVHGLTWGIATTTGSTLIVDVLPPARRGEGIGIYGLAMTIPMALGPLAGIVLSGGGNYPFMFLMAALLAVAGFVLTMLIRYPQVPLTEKGSFRWSNLIERSSLPVTFNLLIINMTYGGLVSFISLYALKTGVGMTGIFFIVFAAGISLSRIFLRKIFDRQGPALLTVSGILLLIAGHTTLGLMVSKPGFMTAAILLGLGSGIVMPTFQAMVNNLVQPHRRGAANSTLFSGLDLGIGLGMLITGILAREIGLPHTYLIYAGLNVLALIYFLSYPLKHYRKKRAEIGAES